MGNDFSFTPEFAIKTLEKALKLYTPSLSEKPMADFLVDKCDEMGFEDIRIDEVGNVMAKKGSGSPRIMLCGHMDVVPGKIRVRREGDYMYGRGASDAKAPLIAMLFAAASVPDNCGTVIFVGAVDEEGNATGVKNLANKQMDADYVVFGEPSGTMQITIAYKGRLAISFRVAVDDSSHASAPWLSKNAIDETMAFARRIKESLEAGQEGRRKGMMLTATMTEIKGGTSHNVTAKECETTFDIRIPVDGDCKSVEQKIEKLVRDAETERGINVMYSILDETEPFEAAHDSPLIRALSVAVFKEEGARPALIRKTGTGDMNILGSRWDIPVVTYGPGDPHQAHTINERVSVSEYMKGIRILRGMMVHLKRIHDRGAK